MLIDQPDGNFTFIKSSGPFSSGCRAQPGYEVVHATCHPLPALEKGYDLIARHLRQLGRPIQALWYGTAHPATALTPGIYRV